jgi:hypothetical protein
MTERLAAMRVGDVDFDDGKLGGFDGIAEGDRGVGPGTGVEDDAMGLRCWWRKSITAPSWLLWKVSRAPPASLTTAATSASMSESLVRP